MSPRCRVFSYRDHYGNDVQHFDIPGDHGQLVIVAESLVEHQMQMIVPAFLAPDAWGALCMEFPELRRLADTLATDRTDVDIRRKILRLYGQHVKEWTSFSALRHLQQQSPTLSTCVV